MDHKIKCWELVNNDLCRQVITNNGIIHIKSPPNILRDYVSEHHFKSLIYHCIKNKNHNIITNVCSGRSISLKELSDIIVKDLKYLQKKYSLFMRTTPLKITKKKF